MTRKKRADPAGIAVFGAALFLFVSVITDPGGSAECVRSTVSALYKNVIPVVFPFMVISKIISGADLTGPLENTVGRLFERFLRLPRESVTPFLLGAVCSFPSGAVSTAEIRKRGKLSKKDAETVAAISNNTGPAFPAAVVGGVMLGNVKTGWLIYSAEIISALIIAFILGRKRDINITSSKGDPPARKRVSELLSDAVSSSALGCVTVVGTVVFFSLLSDRIVCVSGLSSPALKAVLDCLLEFSEGCVSAAALGGAPAAALCAFAVSFGGLSVAVQTAAALGKAGLSARRAISAKFFQGLIAAALVYGAVFIDVRFMPSPAAEQTVLLPSTGSLFPAVCLFFVVSSLGAKIFVRLSMM